MQKRRLVFTLFFVFIAAMTNAQRAVPAAYSSNIKLNYIRTWSAMAPQNNPNTFVAGDIQHVKQATAYVDGLGRPLQTVIKEGSLETGGSTKDLVTAVQYDELGREQYKYLPFVSSNATGQFKYNPFQQQDTFMTAQYGNQGETYFYGQNVFETSSLDRVNKAMSAGNSWVGAGRGVEMKYWFNTTTDSVRKWIVTDVTNSWGTYSTGSTYVAGQLFKNVTADEAGNQVIEFKDKQGKVLLKKVQLTAVADTGTGKGYYGWVSTYYIYDSLSNLRCVIQPEGVKTLVSNGWSLNSTILDEQCFRYEYDELKRMVMKKVPGAGDVYMVYDARDRLVMIQDANVRSQSRWMYTEYDELNRVKASGFIDDTHDRVYHQNLAKISTAYPNLGLYTYALNTHNLYDDYSWLSNYSTPFSATRNTSFDSYLLSPSNSWPYPQAVTQSNSTRGMVTGGRIFIISTGTALYFINFYDDKGRIIQTQSTNITGGVDITTTQYSWSGQPLIIISKTEKAGTNAQTTIVVTQLTYDNLGRLIKTEKKQSNTLVNSNAMSSYKTIADLQYDKIGQLKNKKLSPASNSGAGLENQLYEYNIRGWLLGVNRDYLTPQGQSGSTRFGFELAYDKITSKSNRNYAGSGLFNGNITGMVWKSDGDDVKRKYDFTYDAASRFMKGNYEQDDATSSWNSSTMSYTAQMGNGTDPDQAYDYNGNIKAMTQYGWKVGSPASPIDNLTYTYNTNSNKLLRVIDAVVSDPAVKLGDFNDGNNGSNNDYNYDANGNMILDNNKAISNIYHNYLNQPDSIIIASKGSIKYVYDATGNKLKKIVHETGQSDKTTLYLDGLVYENDVLQFIGMEEGRIRFTPTLGSTAAHFDYDYFIKDHLSNVRMVITEEQKTDAYPAATMETGTIASESEYYGNLTNTQYSKPSWFSDPAFTSSSYVARVSNTTGVQKVGPNMLLKVMASDTINIRVASGWSSTNSATNSQTNILNDLFSLLTVGLAAQSGGKVTQTGLQNSSSGLQAGLQNYLNTQTTSGTKPKAYLNWIFFDEQFKVVAGSSGFEQVGGSGATTPHIKNGLVPTKSGYLYVYTSNEATNIDVFFDNLQVTHKRGRILEETHYYPFGLTMAGISSKASQFGNPVNKIKLFGKEIQSKEFSDESGLEWYDFGLREYDHQIGRFFRVDPISEKFFQLTVYQYCSNDPIKNIDLDGAEGFPFDTFNKLVENTVKNPKGTSAKVLGAVVGIGGSVKDVVTGSVELIPSGNPVEDGMKYMNVGRQLVNLASKSPAENGIDYSLNLYGKYSIPESGNKFNTTTETAMLFHGLTDALMFSTPMKGALPSKTGAVMKTITELSVEDKLTRYLLNPDHPLGSSKAKWFDKALGYSKDNLMDLAKQIKFDENKAVITETNEHGTQYNQVISIKGTKGKTIDVTFAWIKNTDGNVRLVTAFPSKK